MTHSPLAHSRSDDNLPYVAWERTTEADAWKQAFGRAVRAARTERGLSQMALAHLSNMDQTYISSVEQGRRNISLVNIHALAAALNVHPRDLFEHPGVDLCPPT